MLDWSHGKTQYIEMRLFRKDIKAIKNGFEIGVRYFVHTKNSQGVLRTYGFDHKGVRTAIRKIEAAIVKNRAK